MTASRRPDLDTSDHERRESLRVEVPWVVDCTNGENFLYATIGNLSVLGIFLCTHTPLPVGAEVKLSFAPPGDRPLELSGTVVWINPLRPSGDNINPGFGVRFTDMTPEIRERLVTLVHAFAYLRDTPET
jgi:type IV pilus assembly protein PilZ